MPKYKLIIHHEVEFEAEDKYQAEAEAESHMRSLPLGPADTSCRVEEIK